MSLNDRYCVQQAITVAWEKKGKITRRERFLAEMDAVIPWARVLALIERYRQSRRIWQKGRAACTTRLRTSKSTLPQFFETVVGGSAKDFHRNRPMLAALP